MSNKAINFAMFVLGAAIGSVATWNFVKKKYEQLAMDEINSVKEVFSKREKNAEENNGSKEKAAQAKEKPDITEYAAKLQKEGYTNYAGMNTEDKKEESGFIVDQPYVITPDVFGEFDDYETISLSYYADQVLADENDEIVDDVEDIVGFDSLNHFGEYEDDSVFVRNDRLKCDYEILLDQRNYSDMAKQKPHQIEE